MKEGSRAVAIIPARGGSKRVPRKNIKAMSGKPLISWTIELCSSLSEFSEVIVSTDDDEIAAISKQFGATLRALREPGLSDDFTPTVPVIADAILRMTDAESPPDYVCCIYPAALFCTSEDLRESLQLLKANRGVDFVASVVEYPHPIQRAFNLGEAGEIVLRSVESMKMRTQDLSPYYHDAGQFYWGRAEAWLRQAAIFENALGYKLESSRVVDIDTEDDWERAERVFNSLKPKKSG